MMLQRRSCRDAGRSRTLDILPLSPPALERVSTGCAERRGCEGELVHGGHDEPAEQEVKSISREAFAGRLLPERVRFAPGALANRLGVPLCRTMGLSL
jgi:hypothetical protein